MCKYWANFTQCCGIIIDIIFTSCSDGSFNNGPQFFSAGSLSFLENVGITETRYNDMGFKQCFISRLLNL